MTWTAARTWADNELITAALLNQQIRDQFEAVGLHDHSAEPGAVVLTPDRVDLAQQTSAVVSTDPGRFQRTAAGLYYTVGAGQNAFIGEGAAADIAATRSLGALGTQAAAGTHRHAVEAAAVDPSDSRWLDEGSSTGNIRSFTVQPITGERTYAVMRGYIRTSSGSICDVVLVDSGGAELARAEIGTSNSVDHLNAAAEIPTGGETYTLRFVERGGTADRTRTMRENSFFTLVRVYVGAGLSP